MGLFLQKALSVTVPFIYSHALFIRMAYFGLGLWKTFPCPGCAQIL